MIQSAKIKAYMSQQFGLLAFIGLGLIAASVFVVIFAVGLRASGHLPLILLSPDDIIYNQLSSSGKFCLVNTTSSMAEGGCRVRPIWYLGHLLSFGQPAIAAFLLRVILYCGIAIASIYGVKLWAEQAGLEANRALQWFLLLLCLTPLPLILTGNYLFAVPELTLSGSLFYSVPNLLSYLMYIISIGGLYVLYDNKKSWPVLGLVAGFWSINHPYYILFIGSVYGAWWLVSKDKKQSIGWALSLVLPTFLVGLYYLWLSRVNVFFRYHLSTNVTTQWPLSLALTMFGLALVAVLVARHARANGQKISEYFTPRLGLWLGLAIIWQFVPTATSRRMLLILPLPIVLVLVSAILKSPKKLAWLRILSVTALATNALLSAILGCMVLANGLGVDGGVAVRDQDYALASRLIAGQNYASDQAGSARFLWMAPIRIINAHLDESPAYGSWWSIISVPAYDAQYCQRAFGRLSKDTVAGIILQAKVSSGQVAHLQACGLKASYRNDYWVLLTPGS